MLNFFKKNIKSEEVKNKPSLRDRLFKSKKKLAEAENQAKIEELKAKKAEEAEILAQEAAEEAEKQKAETEAVRKAEEAEEKLKLEEEKRKAEEEKAKEAEILAQEVAKEAEEKRIAEEAEKQKAEAEALRKAEEDKAKEAEILAQEVAKEAEEKRIAEEAEEKLKLEEEKRKAKEVKKKPSLKDRLFKSKKKLGDGLSSLIIGKKKIDEDLLEELEILLISSDIGIETTDKVIESVRKKASRKELKDEDSLYQLIKVELESLLLTENLLEPSSEMPFVILVVGINGAGKTTTIGKLAKLFQSEGKSVMLAAGDTFRAAAVEQLQVWGERNDIPVIAQKTGADAASVVYDAYQSAIAKKIDILIADTAGRLHTQDNLMQELEKIKRVLRKNNENAPHETLLVIDGGSGQNAVQQANEFNKSIGLSGLAITKLDGTAKGGVLFSISDSLKLPIRYIGVGEAIEDLKPFNAKDFINALFD